MNHDVIKVGASFWNIRGSFKVGGVLDVGTQAGLVKCKDGHFVMLDCCAMSDEVKAQVNKLTDNGKNLKAILNLHPFHTVSVGEVNKLYPRVPLYGTERHHRIWPGLPWQSLTTDDPQLHDLFADDLAFSVPAGVDFISANENVHFSSVVVYHKATKTLYVDDTLMFVPLPWAMSLLGMKNTLGFHPSLALALEKRAGAADEFTAWVEDLIDYWGGAKNLCAAHTAPLLNNDNSGDSIKKRIAKALRRVKWVLALHKIRYG